MSKRDLFHEAVRQALQKDGWLITHDPLTIEWGGATIKVDLGIVYDPIQGVIVAWKK